MRGNVFINREERQFPYILSLFWSGCLHGVSFEVAEGCWTVIAIWTWRTVESSSLSLTSSSISFIFQASSLFEAAVIWAYMWVGWGVWCLLAWFVILLSRGFIVTCWTTWSPEPSPEMWKGPQNGHPKAFCRMLSSFGGEEVILPVTLKLSFGGDLEGWLAFIPCPSGTSFVSYLWQWDRRDVENYNLYGLSNWPRE